MHDSAAVCGESVCGREGEAGSPKQGLGGETLTEAAVAKRRQRFAASLGTGGASGSQRLLSLVVRVAYQWRDVLKPA